MTQEERELLLKDLCARLPYGVKIWNPWSSVNTLVGVDLVDADCEGPFCLKNEDGFFNYYAGDIKPYLRPMSNMTEEEQFELSLEPIYANMIDNARAQIDWLNAHHFDYRGLIEKGLAIKVTEDNNPYKD